MKSEAEHEEVVKLALVKAKVIGLPAAVLYYVPETGRIGIDESKTWGEYKHVIGVYPVYIINNINGFFAYTESYEHSLDAEGDGVFYGSALV